MTMPPTHLHTDGVQATIVEPKTDVVVRPRVEVIRPAPQPARYEEEGMSWLGVLGLVGFAICMLLHTGISLYEEWDLRQPHTHALLLNVTRYDTPACSSSPSEPGYTKGISADWNCLRWDASAASVSFVWQPHHDIQWLEDFGYCKLSLYETGDCSGPVTGEIDDVANNKTMAPKCWAAGDAKPKSAYMKCEKEWEATYCEKVGKYKKRQKEECGDGSVCKDLKSFWDRATFYMFGGQGWRVLKRTLLG
ncbi:hypothetical protein LTR95_017680 [Oleoguttula sp. CCFEE 5521]